MGWGMGSGMWVGGLLGLLLFLALATAVVVLLVKLNRMRREGVGGAAAPVAGAAVPPQPRDAIALLDERLARGDIEVSDYEARRRALTGQTVADPMQTRVDPLA